MGLLQRVRGRLSRGLRVRIPGALVEVRVTRPRPESHAAGEVRRRALDRLCAEHPELRRYVDGPRGSGLDEPLLEFACDLLPFLHPAAREPQLRNLLLDWRERIDHPGFRHAVDDELARSSVRSGFLDTRLLEAEPATEADRVLREQLRADLERFEKGYEAREGLLVSRERWRPSLRGDLRGRCLARFFDAHRERIRGRRILHVAPERELRQWFEASRSELGLRYETLDPFGRGVDLVRDLADTGLPSESLDVVICHRVLEHVVDELAALAEIRRILGPGGFLSVSVPESMHLEATREWWIPDRAHHHHVRQYGRDFADRLASAGFRVTVERQLLDRTIAEHVADGTYPMRLYSAWR